MEEVIRRTNIASMTLYRWKKKENWDGLAKQFKEKVRKKLEQNGISRYVVKDENLLRVARILFQMGYDSIRPTITEDGEVIDNPNRLHPDSISDMVTLITKAMAIQTEVLGRTKREEPDLDLTEEQIDAIHKILLGKRHYYGDEERRKAAEEFRNRQTQSSSEIPL